jgi:hypothetical protein
LSVAHVRAVGDHLVGEPGEELLEDLAAAGVEPVGLPALGDALPGHRTVGEGVAVDEGDLVEVVGQHPGGEQPREARTEHDRVFPPHGNPSLTCRRTGPMLLLGVRARKRIRSAVVSARRVGRPGVATRPGDLRR